MLSLAKPNQYYQVLGSVLSHLHACHMLNAIVLQIILSQGIGAGLGAGMVYIPSVAVISQYFHKRRALTMTIVASGSSLGSIVHPIMLNNTLNNPKIGFATAARANAGLISGLLLIACFIMRTRTTVQSKPADLWVSAKRFSKDLPYVFAALGYVHCFRT